MNRDIEDIRRALRENTNGADPVFQARVLEVDETEFTCTVKQDERVEYADVRLRAIVDGGLKGLAFIPKPGSWVLVGRIGKSNELYVAQFSEIDKIVFTGDKTELSLSGDRAEIKIGETFFCISEKGTLIKKGRSGLKKTLDDLLTALGQLTVTTPNGPSGIPMNAAAFSKIKAELSTYLEG